MPVGDLGRGYLEHVRKLYRADRNIKSFNVTLMNPDPMNLWSNDHINGDTKGTNHLVHENVEFVRLQFRRPELANGSALGMQERQIPQIYNARRAAKDVVSNGI